MKPHTTIIYYIITNSKLLSFYDRWPYTCIYNEPPSGANYPVSLVTLSVNFFYRDILSYFYFKGKGLTQLNITQQKLINILYHAVNYYPNILLTTVSRE